MIGIKYLTVIKNEIGYDEHDHGVQESPNFVVYTIPEDEFEDLWGDGVFDYINQTCELMIDDFESEELNPIAIAVALEHYNHHPELRRGVFYNALNEARHYNIALELDF